MANSSQRPPDDSPIHVLSTDGCDGDLMLGGGGRPFGTLILVVGVKSESGKH